MSCDGVEGVRDLGPVESSIAVGHNPRVTWIDPVVGMRAKQRLSQKQFVSAMLDVGGFGVSSDSTWQMYGGAGYQMTPVSRWSAATAINLSTMTEAAPSTTSRPPDSCSDSRSACNGWALPRGRHQ
jgi:hypothetical protein